MSSCLGICINDDIVKFAKLSYEKNIVKLEEHGTRFVKLDKLNLIQTLIKETNSENSKIAITPEVNEYINLEAFNQVQSRSQFSDIVKMEFEAWCERTGKSPQKYRYIYKTADVKNKNNKRDIELNVIEKELIEKYTNRFSNISSIYPASLVIERLVPVEEQNYVLVDLSDSLTIFVVINGQNVEIRNFNIGMKQILKDFSGKLGSYQKAYEACKQINVFSEGVNNNDKELELLLEPILQEILKKVQEYVNMYRLDLTKVILTGSGIVFTNIDILFTEFLDVKCEILRPSFIEDTSNVRNTADILEAIEPIALAYDVLHPKAKESEYIKGSIIKSNPFSLFSSNKEKVDKNAQKENSIEPKIVFSKNINLELINKIAGCTCIALTLCLVAYVTFSNIYTKKVDEMKQEIKDSISKIESNISTANSDSSYIDTNTRKYKTINDDVQNVIEQIESNKIGKFTTYNVATFLQNIIKIIPKNVQLVNISSDDNKNVKMTAKSSSYADLGYFVAELKINNTLNNLKINSIQNGTTTVVEIGGELP